MNDLNDFDMLYALVMSDGMGNSTFSENELYWLKEIKKAFTEKYGETDYRVKFLSLCIIKSETGEFEVQDREWVRYILHAESEPADDHKGLLDELKDKIEKGEKI